MAPRVSLLMVMLMRTSTREGTGGGPKQTAIRLPSGEGPSYRRHGAPRLQHVLAELRRRSRPEQPASSPSVKEPR
jgi:hypothetical protein